MPQNTLQYLRSENKEHNTCFETVQYINNISHKLFLLLATCTVRHLKWGRHLNIAVSLDNSRNCCRYQQYIYIHQFIQATSFWPLGDRYRQVPLLIAWLSLLVRCPSGLLLNSQLLYACRTTVLGRHLLRFSLMHRAWLETWSGLVGDVKRLGWRREAAGFTSFWWLFECKYSTMLSLYTQETVT